MTKLKKKKSKTFATFVSIALVVGAISYLLFSSFGESMIYYKTVDEVVAEADNWTGRPVRINGVVVPGSVTNKPGTDTFRFKLSRRGQMLDVDYSGILPDAMKDGQDLMVEGTLKKEPLIFDATEILTKCPSKYEEQAAAISP